MPLGDERRGGGGELRRQAIIRQQSHKPFGQEVDIALREGISGHTVDNRLGGTATGRGHDRNTARLRLQYDEPEALGIAAGGGDARQAEDPGLRQKCLGLIARKGADEANATDGCRALGKLRSLGPVAGDDEFGLRQQSMDAVEGLQQIDAALFLDEAAEKQDHGPALGDRRPGRREPASIDSDIPHDDAAVGQPSGDGGLPDALGDGNEGDILLAGETGQGCRIAPPAPPRPPLREPIHADRNIRTVQGYEQGRAQPLRERPGFDPVETEMRVDEVGCRVPYHLHHSGRRKPQLAADRASRPLAEGRGSPEGSHDRKIAERQCRHLTLAHQGRRPAPQGERLVADEGFGQRQKLGAVDRDPAALGRTLGGGGGDRRRIVQLVSPADVRPSRSGFSPCRQEAMRVTIHRKNCDSEKEMSDMTSSLRHSAGMLSRRDAVRLAVGGAVPPSLAGCAAGWSGAGDPDTCLTLEVDRHRVGPHIGAGFAGFSYEKAHLGSGFFTAANEPLVALFRRLAPSLLRLGGNTVDRTSWRPSGATPAPSAVTPADVDALAAFLNTCGWSVLYGINLAQNSPEHAAEEADYATRALGGRLYGFEIGNEPDGFAFNHYRPASYSYDDFLAQWRQFADAIQRRVPQARLTGPATAWHEQSWTVPFARDEGRRIILLTQHYYRANGLSPGSRLALLLAGDPALPQLLEPLSQASQAAGIRDGYRLTEANSFYDGGAPHVSDTYGAALWAIDFLFRAAVCQASGINFHGGGVAAYTPIADGGPRVSAIRPEYYGMLLFSMMGPGRLLGTSLSGPKLAVSAYAVEGQGKTSIMIVNKEPEMDVRVLAKFGRGPQTVHLNVLAARALTSIEGVRLNGASVMTDGSWSPTPPIRGTIGEDGAIPVTVGRASAVLLMAS
jgi:hypothetical protein